MFDDVIIGGEAAEDDSTDDGEDDIVVTVVARLVPKPCPWVRFAHEFLLRKYLASCYACAKATCGGRTTWSCWKLSTVIRYLRRPLTRRNDVKLFRTIQQGEFLNIRPEECIVYKYVKEPDDFEVE